MLGREIAQYLEAESSIRPREGTSGIRRILIRQGSGSGHKQDRDRNQPFHH
jgi:hypothetical protein